MSSQSIGPEDTLQVSVNVTNTGPSDGQEVVQLYIRDTTSTVQRPEKELKAFAKVQLAVGECRTVTFTLTPDALAYFDVREHRWVAEPGEFSVLVGASSQDIFVTGTLVLTA